MRFLIAALVIIFAVAVTASVFAIWPVVADAPWEDDARSEPAFTRTQAMRLTQDAVATSFPQNPTLSCFDAEYISGNDTWLVKCEIRIDPRRTFPTTLTYVLDDQTGRVDIPGTAR